MIRTPRSIHTLGTWWEVQRERFDTRTRLSDRLDIQASEAFGASVVATILIVTLSGCLAPVWTFTTLWHAAVWLFGLIVSIFEFFGAEGVTAVRSAIMAIVFIVAVPVLLLVLEKLRDR